MADRFVIYSLSDRTKAGENLDLRWEVRIFGFQLGNIWPWSGKICIWLRDVLKRLDWLHVHGCDIMTHDVQISTQDCPWTKWMQFPPKKGNTLLFMYGLPNLIFLGCPSLKVKMAQTQCLEGNPRLRWKQICWRNPWKMFIQTTTFPIRLAFCRQIHETISAEFHWTCRLDGIKSMGLFASHTS